MKKKTENKKVFFNVILRKIMEDFSISPKDIVNESYKHISGGISEAYISSWKTRNPPSEEYFCILKTIICDILGSRDIRLYFRKKEEAIINEFEGLFNKYGLSHVFGLIRTETKDTVMTVMLVLDAAYQNKSRTEEAAERVAVKSGLRTVEAKKIETIKYVYGEDEFYMIDNCVYYHTRYGLRRICANNQTVCSRVYSNEEYIMEDPNRAIAAEKARVAEIEYFSSEEMVQRDLATDLFLYGMEKDWPCEKMLDIISTLCLKKSVIADIVEEYTSED